MRARRPRGYTLVEILVAVLLLSFSLTAMVTLWSLTRKITERSRDASEMMAVARQEIERDKARQFNTLFIASGVSAVNRTDYSQTAAVLATGLASNAAATNGAYYRVVSTYSLATTNATAETDNKRKLGIQQVQVYEKSGSGFSGTASYTTTAFYTAAGV